MIVRYPVEETKKPDPFPNATDLPTMYDLPSEDPEEPGVLDQFHIWQGNLLEETFSPPGYPRERILIAVDLNLYYDVHNTSRYKRPDWFAALDVDHLYKDDMRWSYVIWQEKVVPYIVVEFLSPSTEKEDLGRTIRENGEPPTKWEVYEEVLRIPWYVVYSRTTNHFQAFQLIGDRYTDAGIENEKLWLPELNMGLGLWQGRWKELDRKWLRWYDVNGNWIPASFELTERNKRGKQEAEQRAEQEKRRAEQEKRRADQLEARLRALGVMDF